MSSDIGQPLRLVLLGKTGVGKSAVGNTIIGRPAFVSCPSANSVTQVCSMQETKEDRWIQVTDTPGVVDTERDPKEIAQEIAKCIHLSSPGPHAFLLVIQIGRFTQEEHNAVQALQEIFGKKASDYMIVIFSRGDYLQNQTIQDYVQGGNPKLREIVRRCGQRYVAFNKDIQNRDQVAELVKKVDDLLVSNKGMNFSNELYEMSKESKGSSYKQILEKLFDMLVEKVIRMVAVLVGFK